ncbi:MAG: Phosphomannomutase [Alyxoria varia]|nr:MAG: Phosphomannomutase [Alyxoria varia]
MAAAAAVIPPLHQRPIKNTICLFDVDGTLTPARQGVSPSMLQLLTALRPHVAIGFVGGSNLVKQQEQLGTADLPVTTLFDFCFAENGLTAYRMGEPLASASFIEWLGEKKYQKLVNFCLRYIADLDIPKKRGTFVEFRAGMINVSPIGRNASQAERMEFLEYDMESGVRKTFVEALRKEFAGYGLTFSIGGQLSFDVFPTGWDKTYCLKHVEEERERKDAQAVNFETIHFFGDKTNEGGNDYEIFADERTIGHSVEDPDETAKILKELFPVVKDA